MTKSKGPRSVYTCQSCGNQSPKWLGKCPDCGEWNSFVEERQAPPPAATGAAARGGLFRLNETQARRYGDIESQDDSRRPSGIADRAGAMAVAPDAGRGGDVALAEGAEIRICRRSAAPRGSGGAPWRPPGSATS